MNTHIFVNPLLQSAWYKRKQSQVGRRLCRVLPGGDMDCCPVGEVALSGPGKDF